MNNGSYVVRYEEFLLSRPYSPETKARISNLVNDSKDKMKRVMQTLTTSEVGVDEALADNEIFKSGLGILLNEITNARLKKLGTPVETYMDLKEKIEKDVKIAQDNFDKLLVPSYNAYLDYISDVVTQLNKLIEEVDKEVAATQEMQPAPA